MKYENLNVVTKFLRDYKNLGQISGNSKAEILREIKKQKYNFRMNGMIEICHEDFPKKINSNKL